MLAKALLKNVSKAPPVDDGFYYYHFPDYSLYNFVILNDGKLVFSTRAGTVESTNIMNANETDPVLQCEDDVASLGRVYNIDSDMYYRVRYAYQTTSYFSSTDCIASENGNQLEYELRLLFCDPPGSSCFGQFATPIADIHNNFVVVAASNATGNSIYTNSDGSTWVESDVYTEVSNVFSIQILPNLKPSIGGVMVVSEPNAQYNEYNQPRISNADASSWLTAGAWLDRIGAGGLLQYERISMYYDDKVIVEFYDVDTDIYQLAVLESDGADFLHYMTVPCLPEWTDCTGVYNDFLVQCHHIFTVEPVTETLFGIFSYYAEGHLFKSSDWGLTWELVSNLCSSKVGAICYYTDYCGDISDGGEYSTYMRCHDGYLTLISTDDSDIYQFKLADII